MSFLNGSAFRSIVRTVLFISASWLALLVLLKNDLAPSVMTPLFNLLFWTLVMAICFSIATRSTDSWRYKPSTKLWEGSARVEILSSPETVWYFLHEPQYLPLISPIVKRSFRAPDTPGAAGPQQVMIGDDPNGKKVLWLAETVEEIPFTSFAMQNVNGNARDHFRLDTSLRGTLLTVTVSLPYLRFAAHRISPRKDLENKAGAYAAAVKRVVESAAVPPRTQPNPSHGSSHQPTQPPPTWTTPPNTPPPYNRPNPANPT